MQQNRTNRKRRRSASTDVESSSVKSIKLEDFTVAEFKLLLSDPSTAFEALRKYLDQNERFESGESQLDITAAYCLTSEEFTEILSLVSNIGSYSNKEVYLVFDCLQIILTRVGENLKKYKQAAQAIVKCILSTAMGSVNFQLSIKNKSSFTKSALKLLTAVVQYADWAAREAVTRLDLSQQNFLQLLNCKDLRVADDVKMCLIRLVVAFLLTEDKTVYKVILSKGAFWNVLFSILHGDKAECIVLILEALHQMIVTDETVSKTMKIHLFKEHSLCNITRLYSWSGPKKWNETLPQKKSKSGANKDETPFDVSNLSEEQTLVRETVHKFLVDLCSSTKLGICFVDKSYSTSTQNANHILTALLLNLQQQLQQLVPATVTDPRRVDLIVSILKSCPDQLTYFLPSLRHSSVPRPSIAWQSCTQFIKLLYSKQQISSPAVKVRYTASSEVLVSMMMATLLPPKEVWSNYCTAVKKPWLSVVDESLSFMNLLLRRFEATFKALDSFADDDGYHNERDGVDSRVVVVNRPEYLAECKALLREAAAMAFPDLQSIVECWNNIVRHEEVKVSEPEMGEKSSDDVSLSTDSGVAGIDKAPSSSTKGKPDIVDVLPKKTMTEYLKTIMGTLRLYSVLFPVTFQSGSSLDYSSLLRGIQMSKTEVDLVKQAVSQSNSKDSEKVAELLISSRQLQMETLKLLSSSNIRLNELIAKVKGKPSALTLLLTMSSNEEEKGSSAVLHLITKLLVNSGLLIGAGEELSIWLKHVIKTDPQTKFMQFFEACIETYVSSPYMWIERILKIQSEASTTASVSKKKKIKAKDGTAAEQLIQEIMDEDELRIYDGDNDKATDVALDKNVTSARRLPFTALVPIAMEKLKVFENMNKLRAVVDRTLIDILHLQSDYRPLCLLLTQSGTELELSCSVASRCTSEATQDAQCSNEFKKAFGEFSIGYDLLKLFFSSQTSQKYEKMGNQILASLEDSEISLSQCQDTIRQALFYIAVDAKSVLQSTSINLQRPICLYVEVIHRTLERTWKILERLNKKQKDSNEDDYETDGNTVDMDSPDDAANSSDTRADVYQQLCGLVCSNKAILDCFLAPSVDSGNSLAEMTQKLLKLMADIIPRTLKPSILNRLIDKLMIYIKENDVTNWSPVLLRTVQDFLPVLSADSLILICDKTLSSLSKSMLTKQAGKSYKSPKKINGVSHNTKLGSFVVSIVSRIADSEAVNKLASSSLDVLFSLEMNDSSIVESSADSIHKLLARIVKLSPGVSGRIACEMLERYLDLGTQSSLNVIGAAVAVDARFYSAVVGWFSTCARWKKKSRMFGYIGLIADVLEVKSDPEVTVNTFKDLVHSLYWEILLSGLCSDHSTLVDKSSAHKSLVDESSVHKSLVDESSVNVNESSVDRSVDTSVRLLLILCQQSASIDELKDAWQKLSTIISSCDWLAPSHCVLYTGLLQSILSRSGSDSDEVSGDRDVYLAEFFSASVQALINQITLGKEKKVCSELFDSICKISKEHSVASPVLSKALSSTVWASLARQGLKKYYTNVGFLRTLDVLAGILYKSEEVPGESDRLKVVDLHGMIISHSQFIPSLLTDSNDTLVKDALVSLLLTLCQLDTSSCSASHVPVLMSSYRASMSAADQKLLSLLQLYDQQGKDKSIFKPYLWGEKAVEYQTGKKHLGLNLWKEPTMDQVLELLEDQKLLNTILNFPLQRSLVGKASGVSHGHQCNDTNCYDPAFLLPLFSCITEPQYVVYCSKFIQRHCLGFVLTALSSHQASVRSLAYHILAQFYTHVDGARFVGKNQVLVIFDLLRNSLHKKNDKLSCVITTFLARAVQIVISPGHEMYLAVMSFLSLKPALDVLNVPEFYKLFFSSDLSYRVERAWLIDLLIDGLRETNDYHLCERRFIYKIIMGFYDTPLCDHNLRVQILKFLTKSCSISNVAWDLIKNHSLLPYLAAISCRKADTSANQAIIESLFSSLLTTLWQTLLQKYSKQQSQAANRHECLPPSVVAEMNLTCRTVLSNFGMLLDTTSVMRRLALNPFDPYNRSQQSQKFICFGSNPLPLSVRDPSLSLTLTQLI